MWFGNGSLSPGGQDEAGQGRELKTERRPVGVTARPDGSDVAPFSMAGSGVVRKGQAPRLPFHPL